MEAVCQWEGCGNSISSNIWTKNKQLNNFKLTGIELELNQTDRFSGLIGSMYVAGDLLSSLMCTIQNSVENAF